MKLTRTSLFRLLACGIASATLPEAQAVDYSLALASDREWSTANWAPTGVPGSEDTISDISGASALYLGGNREVASFGKTSTGTIRLMNGTSSGGANNTLNITEEFSIKGGIYTFRGTDLLSRFTVTTRNLTIGDVETGGTLRIGDTIANQNVTFTVSGTTILTGSNAGIQVGATSGADAATYVDLGHVIFHDMETTGGTAGIGITPTGVTVSVKSLRTTGDVYTSASIRGSGILLINGTANDPLQPAGANSFASNITGDVVIKKAGSGTQIFSRLRGNNYTGGTEINGGILAVSNTRNNESALGTGNVVVNSGGALAASGFGVVRLGANNTITVKNGGSIAPGALQGGFTELVLNSSANGTAPLLTMEAGANFTFQLGADNKSDLITFVGYTSGDLVLNNTAVNITGTIGEGIYKLFSFKSNESTASSTGALTSIASGLTGGLVLGTGFSGYTGTFYYDDPLFGGVGSIALELTAIPEPGSVGLILASSVGFALFLRSRKWS